MRGPIYRTPQEKAARWLDQEVSLAAEHRLKVRYDGSYRAVCGCGWTGERRPSVVEAKSDAMAHEKATA